MKKITSILILLLLLTGLAHAGSAGGPPYRPGAVAITGGTINNTSIGATTPASVYGTSGIFTLRVSGATTSGTYGSSAIAGAASASGTGVYGSAVTGYGLMGVSTNGIGMYSASSFNYGAVVEGDTTSPAKAAFRITPQDAQPTGSNSVGDIYVTTAGVLKICTVAGSPGTWVSVGAQP